MAGGTTFCFVSDGIDSAFAQAKAAARGHDIWLAGGASVVNQYLAARLVDEIDVSIAPLILGAFAKPRVLRAALRGGGVSRLSFQTSAS